ncbi:MULTISPECIES: amidohydrolase family protein [unclassified Nocardioides]|uniref:amidohydrolase family protein n=1 Tax=unclassified Nocardioides TaxID=2615069 RepID=UPI001F1E0072|nr:MULTISPECIES: amidohydrolase family protein [unclassified Nocardioides]
MTSHSSVPRPQAATQPPIDDDDIPRFLAKLGLPGLVDLHVHFLPDQVMRKVWSYFDDAEANYGLRWPIRYRWEQAERADFLRRIGVRAFAPLVYPHKPGMARWLNEWVREFAAGTPEAVVTATVFPEHDVLDYLSEAVAAGARAVKVHVQVGAFDPREPVLQPVWEMLAASGLPVVTHCGHGPLRGAHTGLDVFGEVLHDHPDLTVVLAHAGMPDYDQALKLATAYERVHLDTTMVGTAFTESHAPLPTDWSARLVDVADRIVLGSDFPQLPYAYCEQLSAIAGWAAADDRLGDPFLRSVLHDAPARLLRLDS